MIDPELTKAQFWATHYWLLMENDEVEASDLVEPLFGLRPDLVSKYYEQLVRPAEAAKVMSVSLEAEFGVGVDYARSRDAGDLVRFYITHPTYRQPELLGYYSPHFALPAFRWNELKHIHSSASDTVEGAAAALLMFPATYLANDEVAEASKALTMWWKDLGYVKVAGSDDLIRNAVEHRRVPDVRWRHDPTLGWITDGQYSFRNPTTLMCAFSKQRFDRVAHLLSAIGA